MLRKSEGQAGAGGSASVEGDHSFAIGGDGGDGPSGGSGGAATVKGNNSGALGGPGGRGGVQLGGPGGNASVQGDSAFAAGGQGGEGAQIDGRGGRGGRAFPFYASGRHLKSPWWLPRRFEPGRGGEAADTLQYCARRIIIELLKKQYFTQHSILATEEHIWYDRDTVPLEWINERIFEGGHVWRVSLKDWEYHFEDTQIK